MLIGVYASLFPLYWEYGSINYSGEGRTYIIPYFIFCGAVVIIGVNLLYKISDHLPSLDSRVRANRHILELLTAGIFSLLIMNPLATRNAARALKVAPSYLKAQQVREDILRSPENRSKAVILDVMTLKPIPLYWGDVMQEPNHWINKCMASYYGVSSICAAQSQEESDK